MLVIGLRSRQLRLGSLQLIGVVLLPDGREYCALGYPIANVEVAHAAVGTSHLADAGDVSTRLECQVDLGIGHNVGGVTRLTAGGDGLDLRGSHRSQRA